MPLAGRILLICLALDTACSSGPPPVKLPAHVSPAPLSGRPTGNAGPRHVFVIVLENRSFAEALADPVVAALAARFALLTNYHAVSHPSLPNYLALTSGSTWGVTGDGYQPLPAAGLGDQLDQAHISWRAYMEAMTRGCFDSPYPYALKHNPFAYYGAACPAQVVPWSQLTTDLVGSTPRLVWITPDLCHDGHDCALSIAAAWLQRTVATVLASPAWKQGGILFVTWDEDDGSQGNQVATLVIAPRLLAHRSAAAYDHYSLLATVEDQLGLSRLGRAAEAQPIRGLWP